MELSPLPPANSVLWSLVSNRLGMGVAMCLTFARAASVRSGNGAQSAPGKSFYRLPGLLILSLLVSVAVPGIGSALDPSGAAVEVDPAASASGAAGSRILEIQGPVFMGDEIKTSSEGEAQILFVDETRLVVGPNSKLLIDEFVFSPNNTAQAVTISAVKGAFRFISGKSSSQAYSIKTPTMTVGVRGTAFDIAVRPGGETSLALFDGSVTVCDATRRCAELAESCAIVIAPPGGGLAEPASLQDLRQRLAVSFPYIGSQSGLAPGFRVNTSGCRDANSIRAFRAPPESGLEKRADSTDRPGRVEPPRSSPPSDPGPVDPDGSGGGPDSGEDGGNGGPPDGS